MRKILLLMPRDSSFLPSIRDFFKKKNWKVIYYDYRQGNITVRFLRFMPIIGGFEKATQKIFEDILTIANDTKPDLILVIKGENLNPEFLEKLKSKNPRATMVNWFPDPLSQWELMKRISPYYDFFFHFDKLIIRRLKKSNNHSIFYLPFAAEITELEEAEKIFDVSFVGTYQPEREKYLQNLKDFNLNIWGDSRWGDSKLAKFTRGGRISQSEMKQIIKKSKININLHFQAEKEGTNLRTFEVTGSGGFLLTEYVKDLKNLFAIGKEIICFRSPKQMRQYASYYLKNDILREKIALAGYRRALRQHSYPKRMEQMLAMIDKDYSENLKK